MNRDTARQRLRLRGLLLTLLTSGVMIVTLLSLEPIPGLPANIGAGASAMGHLLLQIVTVAAALAVIIGLINLVNVHVRNLRRFPASLYSLLTLLALLGVLLARLLEWMIIPAEGRLAGVTPTLNQLALPALPITVTLMDVLQVTVESALAGLLFFFLVYAAYRMMRRQATLWKFLFVVSLAVVLLGYSPISGTEILSVIREWLLGVPVNGGLRGLLIGVSLGTIVVGARLLIGGDRTFRE